MKSQKLNIALILSLSAALLWGCSGGGPASDFDNSKKAQPQAQPQAAAPPSAPVAPAPEPAPIQPERPAVRERMPVKSAAPKPPQSAPVSPAPQQAAQPALPPQSATPPPPAPVPVPQASAPVPVPVPSAPPEPTTKQVTIPAGTQIFVRTIDPISSEGSHPGETYRASLDQPIVIDNQTIVPRRGDVDLKLVEVESAGKVKGTSELKVQLDKIYIDKKPYAVTSNVYSQSGSSSGAKAARNAGIGAAVGGVLGGILGGGKGAVIGAGAGGGGGVALSKGEQIRIDSETALVFRLENPLDVTITTRPATAPAGGPAKLAPAAAAAPGSSNVVGTWTVTTDNTQRPLQLVLRQSGNNIDGTISNPAGGADIPVHGSMNGNYVTFATRTQSGTAVQMQFSGAVQGDTMQGTVTTTNPYSNVSGGGYPGGGYPGGGNPGGGGRRRGGGYPGGSTRGASTQANWSAQRID
jgi:hypothetical protein